MYYHNFYQKFVKSASMKDEGNNSKSNGSKIFRPWDVSDDCSTAAIVENGANVPQQQQDCTISTTTEVETEEIGDDTESTPNNSELKQEIDANKTCSSENSNVIKLLNETPNSHPSSPFYPDFPPIFFPAANLEDPFLLESLSQHGYAIEDYARVISQEHQAKLLNSRKQRPKKYRCPHCNVGFSNNGQLKGHIRIHTGERPFKCEEANCGKTFTRNEELTRHKRIHSGLRPFPCTQCGKRFGRKDHLKKHSRTHMQPRGGLYAVPVMLPLDTWTAAMAAGMYPYDQNPFAY